MASVVVRLPPADPAFKHYRLMRQAGRELQEHYEGIAAAAGERRDQAESPEQADKYAEMMQAARRMADRFAADRFTFGRSHPGPDRRWTARRLPRARARRSPAARSRARHQDDSGGPGSPSRSESGDPEKPSDGEPAAAAPSGVAA